MKYSTEFRRNIVHHILNHDAPITKISTEFKVSRPTIYRWIGRYKKDGLDGLIGKSRKPKTLPNKLPGNHITDIISVALDYPDRSVPQLQAVLAKRGIIVARTTIQKYLSEKNLSKRSDRIHYLLKRYDYKSDKSLEPSQVEALEKISEFFRDRHKIASEPERTFFIRRPRPRLSKNSASPIEAIYFIDLHSFYTECIVDDSYWIPDPLNEKFQNEVIQEYHVSDNKHLDLLMVMHAWMMKFEHSKPIERINLLWWSDVLDKDSTNKFSKYFAKIGVRIQHIDHLDSIPLSFINRIMSNQFAAQRKAWKLDTKSHSESDIADSEFRAIEQALDSYNHTDFKEYFLNAPTSPYQRAVGSTTVHRLSTIPLSKYATRDFLLPDMWKFGDALREMLGSDVSIREAIETDDKFDIEDTRTNDNDSGIGWDRIGKEFKHKKRYDISDPDSEINKLRLAIPFGDVYEKVMKVPMRKEANECPSCGELALAMNKPRPNDPLEKTNIAFCAEWEGGCNKQISSLNLLYFKFGLDYSDSFKWLLANFDTTQYGYKMDYPL